MKKKDHSEKDVFSQSREEELFGHELSDSEGDAYALADALDVDILMHRDAHFGGKFSIMLDYYRRDGKGTNPEFEIPRIEELQQVEQDTGENLAALLLSGPDAEHIARAREAYRKLREITEAPVKSRATHAQLLANLILGEDPELNKEIAAIVAAGKEIVPALIQLIESDEYYDPLYPGYGLAPIFAAHCLGKLQDDRAVPVLFGNIGKGDFFHEDTLCQALCAIGDSAKAFLLKVVQSRPLNDDNACAALALSYFANDPEVSAVCLQQLQKGDVLKHEPLSTYLIMSCLGLRTPSERKAFGELGQRKDVSDLLKHDIKAIQAQW